MAMHTVSDELYRRHEREWAAFRDAVEANAGRRQQDQPADAASYDEKTAPRH